MNRANFWKGFLVGAIVFILLSAFAYNKFVVQPDISLTQMEIKDLNGEKIDLTSYKGKPLVVNFWATWCAPCIKEFPYFEKVKQEYKNEVNFVMISDESTEKIPILS